MDINLKKIYLDSLIINYNKCLKLLMDELIKENIFNEELENIKTFKKYMDENILIINNKLILLILLND